MKFLQKHSPLVSGFLILTFGTSMFVAGITIEGELNKKHLMLINEHVASYVVMSK